MECPLFDGEYGTCNIIGETKADATEERAECCPLVEIVTCKDCGENIGDYDVPIHNAIIIPEGVTNGDMIKAMFDIPDSEIDEGLSTTYIYTSKRVLKGGSQDLLRKQITFSRDWWNAPYKGNLSEKPTGSESEE